MVTPTAWRCPTCGSSRQKSTEHVIPKWLLKHWGPGVFTGMPGDPWERQLIKVFLCTPCNAYFNTELEQECAAFLKRMMLGEKVTLTPRQHGRIAAWFVKMWLLMSLWPNYENSDDPFLSTADRHEFRRSLAFPRGTRMWLGAVENASPEREQAVIRAIPECFQPPATTDRWMVPVGSICRLIQIKHVFAVVFRLQPPEFSEAQPTVDARVVVRHAEQAGLLGKIWPPPPGNITWPPPLSFEKATYEYWSVRFGYVPPGTSPNFKGEIPRHGIPPDVLHSLDRWLKRDRAR